MRMRLAISTLATTAAISLAAVLTTAPANATPAMTETNAVAGQIVGADGFTRTLSTDSANSTGLAGVSSSVTLAPGDRLIAAPDGQRVYLIDVAGDVLFTLSAPTLGTGVTGQHEVAAKLVVSGNHIVITPATFAPMSRAACASSFWGNVIFNVGMAGMCAALAVGTVVGGVVCTAALIGANTQINFDSKC